MSRVAYILIVLICVSRYVHAEGMADAIKFKGDIRVRFEDIDEEGKERRQRDRYRLRLGAEAKVNEDVDAKVGLTTGDGDPVSGNQTMGDVSSKKDVNLDYAEIDWSVAEKVVLIGGKMKNPMHRSTALIWDSDVTPEGFAVNASAGSDDFKVMLNAGYFWISELKSSQDDVKLISAQIASSVTLSDGVTALVGVGFSGFDNVKGAAVSDLHYNGDGKSFGNSTEENADGADVYANDYALTEIFGELSMTLGVPVALKAHYVSNGDSDADDAGYEVGVKFGKAKKAGSAEFAYSFAELEKDCVLGALTDSDRWGGGTDGRGHKIGAKYQIAGGLQCGATYFINDKHLEGSKDYNRLQLDLVAKF